jgi:hypothetical protein
MRKITQVKRKEPPSITFESVNREENFIQRCSLSSLSKSRRMSARESKSNRPLKAHKKFDYPLHLLIKN